MKLALLYELQIAPGGPDYEYRTVHEALEQISLADEVGFDTVWTVEHHFLVNFSASPCPEVFYGALSQRTKRIRLGLGVIILPYHHPVRVAERVAMLDILSNGRIEFGTGRSGPYEQVGMGVDPRLTRAMWDESLHMITRLWATEGEFSYEGQFWQFPPRVVLPRPIQQPHPPLWVACLQPDTYRVAAERGLGVLSFNANVPALLAEHIQAYRETVQRVQPVGAFANNQWGNFAVGFCGDDDREARELGAQAVREFFGPGRPYAAASRSLFEDLVKQWGGEVPAHLQRYFQRFVESGSDLTGAAAQAAIQSIWEQLDADTLCDSGAIIAGDPESCIRGILQHQQVGADMVIILMQNATVPHEKVMRSIELFGKYVIPYFRQEAGAGTTAASTD